MASEQGCHRACVVWSGDVLTIASSTIVIGGLMHVAREEDAASACRSTISTHHAGDKWPGPGGGCRDGVPSHEEQQAS